MALDSSVLISAYISRAGVCAGLLEDVLMQHRLIISDHILGEVARKLGGKFRFDAGAVERVIASLSDAAERVVPAVIPPGSCRDPDDLPILGTSVAGRVEVLVTGDSDLLTLQQFEGIRIVRPGEFWRVANP